MTTRARERRVDDPHQRAVQVVNDWYNDMVDAAASAITANNNDELETCRRERADLEDKLEQSSAHRKLLVADYKQIQEKLAVVATRKKEISRENQRLLAVNFEQSQLICEILAIVVSRTFHGFNHSGAVARIDDMITRYVAACGPAPDQSHHNED